MIQRFIKQEKGQSLIEFAVILPILILLIIGILDFGRVLYTSMHLHLTAQETVRVASFGTRTDTEIIQFARNHFRGDTSQLEIHISPGESERKAGDYVTVQLRYPVEFFTPGTSHILPSPFWLQTDSTIRVERVGSH